MSHGNQLSVAQINQLRLRAVQLRIGGSTLKTIVRVARALDREAWLLGLAPRPTVSPIDVLRSSRTSPRRRVYRARGN